jgi:hypothetical protein
MRTRALISMPTDLLINEVIYRLPNLTLDQLEHLATASEQVLYDKEHLQDLLTFEPDGFLSDEELNDLRLESFYRAVDKDE